MNEDQMRDHIAKNLSIIAQNLEMLGKPEHHLKNLDGSSGFIDLLTRNSLNKVYVPIELKKTRQSARQAIHEVFKYVALLQKQYKLQAHEIAPIVAAVDWDDLITPFSEFKRTVPFDVKGLRLILDDGGVPISSEEVELLPKLEGLVFCPEHLIIFFEDETDRDSALGDLNQIVANNGIEDFVMLRLSYSGANDAIPYRFAIYFAMTGVSADVKLRMKSELEAAPKFSGEYIENDWYFEEQIQANLLTDINRWPYALDTEIGDPFKFSQMLPIWKLDELHRGGPALSHTDVRTDNDILYSLASFSADNLYYFAANSNPSLKYHWRNFRQNLNLSLAPDDRMAGIVSMFLDEMSPNEERDVTALVLFRNSIVMDISATHRENSTRLPYMLEIRLHPTRSTPPRALIGAVCWDGITYPTNARQKFEELFGDTFSMLMAKQLGDPEFEDELLQWLGLSYEMFEIQYHSNREQIPTLSRLELDGNIIRRLPSETIKLQPYASFAFEHSTFLDSIVDEIDTYFICRAERMNAPDEELIGTNELVLGNMDISEWMLSKYGDNLKPEIARICVAHSIRYVWLEVHKTSGYASMSDDCIDRLDLGIFVSDGSPMFSPFSDLDTLAKSFMRLDPYFLVMTTDLFTEKSRYEICEARESNPRSP